VIYLITLNPAIDTKIEVDEFGGRDCIAQKVEYFLASKAINSAKPLIINNINFCSLVFSGKIPFESVTREGHEFFFYEGSIRQNFTIYKNSQLVSHIRSKSVATYSDIEQFFNKIKGTIGEEDYLVIAGSTPSLKGDTDYSLLTKLVSDIRCEKILDTTTFDGGALKNISPHTLKINIKELSSILSVPITNITKKDLINLHKDIKCRLVITQASGKVLAVDKNGGYSEFILPNQHISKSESEIGSGDIFLGGYLAGLSTDIDFSNVIKTAMAYASIHQKINLLYEKNLDVSQVSRIKSAIIC